MTALAPKSSGNLDRSSHFVLTGGPVTIDDVVAVASGRPTRLDPECAHRLDAARRAVLQAARSGAAVYGLTTGVGALKEVPVDQDEVHTFNRRLILSHRVSHGDPVPHSVVRATMICRAQGLAVGGAGVRSAVVQALLDALNEDDIPMVRTLGSIGQADLAPLAEIAEHLIRRGL